MTYLRLAVLFFFPAALAAQDIPWDTLPHTDTIPQPSTAVKGAINYTYETTVDTVRTLVINEFMASNSGSNRDNYGDDDDWFEILNYGDDPVILNRLFFTDDPAEPLKWKLDTLVNLFLDPGEHFLIWADGEQEQGYNHAAFKLSAEGEYLAIFTEDGTLVDQRYFGAQTVNISYGRYPDGGLSWNYFSSPSPGAANALPGAGAILPAPSSNLKGGFYTGSQLLALSSNTAGARIYYTTDCTIPDSTDRLYQVPVEISTTTIIRAKLVMEGAMDSPVLTISILMDETAFENPVVSLVAEPETLFGNRGIISADNVSLEADAHMEYIDLGKVLFKGGTGIQLHAPGQAHPNSLRLYARTLYGNNWFDYPFFDDQAPDKFKRLILRNSGNDNVNKAATNTHFRDPLIQDLARQTNRRPLVSASKPVNVFLNGSYHGLFNLREREDRYYIETHSAVRDDFDFIERAFGYYANLHVIEGSYDAFRDLLTFADTTGDLSQEADYNLVTEMVDLENFTDYWITEVFVGNYDWLSNNIKFWKPENGKWQWLYWDTDHGLGLKYSSYGNVNWNTLHWSLTFSDRAWSNGYNNILIRNLLRNEAYKAQFITRFNQLLCTSFSFEKTKPLLDSMKRLYQEDMKLHTQHWAGSMSNWNQAIGIVEDYLQRRPDTVLNHLRDFFGLKDPVPLSIRVEPPGAGTISFSGMDLGSEPLEGSFFPEMNYQLQSRSFPGFSFDRWKPFHSSENSVDFILTDTLEVVAYFLPSDQSFPIQLCEVYANNREAYDAGDWMEFYYYGSEPLNLEGWAITGDNGQLLHTFGEEAQVNPGQRFVVCEDMARFREVFPAPMCLFGDMNQGFSENTTLSLKSGQGEVRLTIELMASTGWPALPEEGFSIELRRIIDDPGSGANWEISKDLYGSPGLPFGSSYSFREPLGKDSVFTSHETHLLAFHSSQDFYQDPDHHSMEAISIKEITGPGHFYLGETRVVQGAVLEPADLVFSPREPMGSSTMLIYSFTDKSGQESADYALHFNPALQTSQALRESFRHYPVPARDYCIIEIPPDHRGPIEFFLFDMNGKRLQARQFNTGIRALNIDLTHLESGMYFYLIKTGKAVVNGKIEVIK